MTYQIKNMKLTLSIQSSCKNHVIQAYYKKFDFIEKTCPNYDLFVESVRKNGY